MGYLIQMGKCPRCKCGNLEKFPSNNWVRCSHVGCDYGYYDGNQETDRDYTQRMYNSGIDST